MKKITITLILSVFSLVSFNALALDEPPLDKSKLVAMDGDVASAKGKPHCLDDEETMAACRSFIKGFIQGALLTDTAIIESLEKAEPTFSERAMRTRLGNKLTSPTALAGFCLPADRSILELAEITLDHVKDSERNSVELAKNVYQTLKTDYPCK